MRISIFSILFALIFFLSSCSDDNSISSSDGEAATWSATINNVTGQILISNQNAYFKADGGSTLNLEGAFNAQTVTFSLEIGGSVNIAIPEVSETNPSPTATLQIGSADINVTLKIDTTFYRGTSGTMTLTKYGTNAGDTISGSIDIGLVGLSISASESATLKGDFSTLVSGPVPSS